ncbi:MAG: hypothetical protein KGL39_18680 [Patescibacteria group bacterium]|nr:hypothetical protein [Patescibacteria group bacterium]
MLSREQVIAMERLIISPIEKYITLPNSTIVCSLDSAVAHLIDHDAEQRQTIDAQAARVKYLEFAFEETSRSRDILEDALRNKFRKNEDLAFKYGDALMQIQELKEEHHENPTSSRSVDDPLR